MYMYDLFTIAFEGCIHFLQVLLQPSREVLAKRVAERAAQGTHFMPASLLDSQLALMEVDPSAYRYGEHLKMAVLHLRHSSQSTLPLLT